MAESTGATRRDFLKTSAALSTAIGAPTIIPSRVLGRDGQPGAEFLAQLAERTVGDSGHGRDEQVVA